MENCFRDLAVVVNLVKNEKNDMWILSSINSLRSYVFVDAFCEIKTM